MRAIELNACVALYAQAQHFVVDDAYLRHHNIIPIDFELNSPPPLLGQHITYKQGLNFELENNLLGISINLHNMSPDKVNAQVSQLEHVAQNYVRHFQYIKFRMAHRFQFVCEDIKHQGFIKNVAGLSSTLGFGGTQGHIHAAVAVYKWQGKNVYIDMSPVSSKENKTSGQPMDVPFLTLQLQYPEDYGTYSNMVQEVGANYKQAKEFVSQIKAEN